MGRDQGGAKLVIDLSDGESIMVDGEEIRLQPIGYIYFVRAPINGLIKIGFSERRPEGRFKTHDASSPVPLERFAIMRGRLCHERMLHDEFDRYRVRGEWFLPHEALLAFIRDNAKKWDDSFRDGYDEETCTWIRVIPKRKRGRPRKSREEHEE